MPLTILRLHHQSWSKLAASHRTGHTQDNYTCPPWTICRTTDAAVGRAVLGSQVLRSMAQIDGEWLWKWECSIQLQCEDPIIVWIAEADKIIAQAGSLLNIPIVNHLKLNRNPFEYLCKAPNHMKTYGLLPAFQQFTCWEANKTSHQWRHSPNIRQHKYVLVKKYFTWTKPGCK